VHYDCNLERVEKVTLEVARDLVTHAAGANPAFESLMRFHTFADSSINFTVWLGAMAWASSLPCTEVIYP
jgi:small-conductance mechanosensitive channel